MGSQAKVRLPKTCGSWLCCSFFLWLPLQWQFLWRSQQSLPIMQNIVICKVHLLCKDRDWSSSAFGAVPVTRLVMPYLLPYIAIVQIKSAAVSSSFFLEPRDLWG